MNNSQFNNGKVLSNDFADFYNSVLEIKSKE